MVDGGPRCAESLPQVVRDCLGELRIRLLVLLPLNEQRVYGRSERLPIRRLRHRTRERLDLFDDGCAFRNGCRGCFLRLLGLGILKLRQLSVDAVETLLEGGKIANAISCNDTGSQSLGVGLKVGCGGAALEALFQKRDCEGEIREFALEERECFVTTDIGISADGTFALGGSAINIAFGVNAPPRLIGHDCASLLNLGLRVLAYARPRRATAG